jgi:lipoate-protein ligase A
MAADFLMLQRYPDGNVARFRHYAWRTAAFTFGYSQKIGIVREQLPREERFELCRRPTGGGIVDHRDDWTYALVIPRGHPLEELPATQSYRVIHAALAETLRTQNVAAELKAVADENDSALAGVCFDRAEIHDVVEVGRGRKIAGAAQKRNKHGLLFQGSIARVAVPSPEFDWDRFEMEFSKRLARELGTTPSPTPWPEFNEEEVSGLTEQYASASWIEFR